MASNFSKFLLWPIIAGLLAGVAAILFLSSREPETRASIPAPQATAAPQPATGPVSYSHAVDQAAPAVVNIYSTRIVTQRRHPLADNPLFQRFFGIQPEPKIQRMLASLGSGVIVSDKGYILTNNHVIANADEVFIALRDGRETRASIVGTDPDTDLAVLRINLPDLPVIQWREEPELRIGDVVLAIGNPYNIGQTVTMGIVSATGRKQGLNTFEDFIQTDAAINAGNSGGALVDANGRLIGINTAIFSQNGNYGGISFAIPVHIIRRVMNDIIDYGHVIRGWLGVEVKDLTPSLVKQLQLDTSSGFLVSGVLKQGPAGQAGLRPGDVVTGINGMPVADALTAMYAISDMRPGSRITLQILRKGKPLELVATVGERPYSEQRRPAS